MNNKSTVAQGFQGVLCADCKARVIPARGSRWGEEKVAEREGMTERGGPRRRGRDRGHRGGGKEKRG